jgi:photosynthetic reaction center M subunit
MLASVDWNPIQLVRQLFWLALEPPPPAYGLSIPPLAQGGWWLIVGFMLTVSILLWWARTYRRARQLGFGNACGLGLRCRDMAVSGVRFFPSHHDGQLV